MKKENYLVFIGVFSLIFLAGVVSVQAKSPTPLASELDVQLTYFSPYNSEYKIADALISGKTVDLMFLQGLRDSTKLDLGKSVWESTHSIITGNNEYSLTMGNNTWNTATSDGMTVNTQATCNAPETLITFKATSNATAVAQYASTYSYFSWDGNDDGDYADTADRHYLPHDENIWILVNNEFTSEDTDAQTYSLVVISLKTTTSTNYDITLKYWYTQGDSGWDVSGSNGATLDFYDCSGIPVVTVIPLADLLDADTGDAVNIIGTDYYRQYLYRDSASKYVQNELKNLAYFTSMPAFTDPSDDDNDWDFDGSDEYFTGIDTTDYLFTVITQDTTDTYDNSQELLLDKAGSITTVVPARYLYFTGCMAVYPDQGSSWGSSTVSAGKYLTTEYLSFDTREINDLDSLANVLSVSTWKFNVTLEDSVCWDADHYENNIVTFVENGINQLATFRSAWSITVDDSEVQYDIADPSTTTGDLDTLTLAYYTASNFGSYTITTSPSGETGATTGGQSNLLIWVLVIAGAITAFFLVKRKK